MARKLYMENNIVVDSSTLKDIIGILSAQAEFESLPQIPGKEYTIDSNMKCEPDNNKCQEFSRKTDINLLMLVELELLL